MRVDWERLLREIDDAIRCADITLAEIDAMAVAISPGLAGSRRTVASVFNSRRL